MTQETLPSLAEWERGVGTGVSGDPLWTVQAYRFSLYAIASHAFDVRAAPALATAAAADQLMRALGSIAANIAEGFWAYPEFCV